MSVEDDLFAPIIVGDVQKKLRELVRKIMASPADDKMTTNVANQIVELFGKQGITNENEIVDAVHRIIKELNGHQYTSPAFLFGVAIAVLGALGTADSRDGSRELLNRHPPRSGLC